METVARFLQVKANTCPPASPDFDLFGRSSFNRYYYAAYLQVRSMLGDLDKAWGTVQHASIPDLLVGQVRKKIRCRRRRAAKVGDTEAVQICGRAMASASELAALMKEAYAVRVTADYFPDVTVVHDDGERFTLNSVGVTEAHDWVFRARRHSEAITRALRLPGD